MEAPDCQEIGLDQILNDIKKLPGQEKKIFTIENGNHLNSTSHHYEYYHLNHWLYDEYARYASVQNDIAWNQKKVFGIFVGRSNWLRLGISSFLFNYYPEQSEIVYQYDPYNEWHADHFDLEEHIKRNFNTESIDSVCNFIKHLPIKAKDDITFPVPLEKTANLEYAYKDIFVDIVCETFFKGKTFHMSEKTLRPILFKRPFMVQGPEHYLQNLKHLGFKTFDRWWCEAYDTDSWDYKAQAIIENIKYIASQPKAVHEQWYKEMLPTLDHNFAILKSLSDADWSFLNKMLNEKYNEYQ